MAPFTQANSLNILVIEDNFGDFLLLKENIYLSKIPVADIQLAETLASAIEQLKQSKPDIVFLDLYLPDSNGLNSFSQLQEYVTGSAVIILSGLSDTKAALEAISLGAQDYLAKGEFDEKLLEKTITYSIERKRNLEILRQANERYSLVTKATHDLIWDWDLLTNEVYRDGRTLKDENGASSYRIIHNMDSWKKRIHPDDAERWIKTIEEIKISTQDSFELEYRVLDSSNIYKYIYDRGYVVRNAEGKALRLIGAAQDITEKLKLEAELRESQLQQQRALTEATIKGQENEREELGKELHDNINQILATSKLYLDYAMTMSPIDKESVMKGKEFISQATEEIRRLSKALLPPSLDEFGLIPALDELISTISITGKFKIEKEWEGFEEKVLQKDQKLTVYRIVQEQLNNIIKHAEAKNVTLTLHQVYRGENKIVELLIKDNGKGFNPAQKRNGVGLRNIISRSEIFGGTVSIHSAPGQGCELKVSFPT
ncbi:MAG: response regulator [Chitinophagaceae bacterium]